MSSTSSTHDCVGLPPFASDLIERRGVSEIEWMRMALDHARAHRPSPNPRVGAVVVREGRVVGVGAHQRAGDSHAEVHALADAGTLAEGATLYVTLEPCAHTGRTRPCVEAIRAAGVTRVVYAMADPNPLAAGGGALLAEEGLEVSCGLLEDQARMLNREWLHAQVHGRPWVRWKVAATLDGRTAAADGTSKWITSPAARADVQRLRAEVDAIITGTGTALADNPRMDVRDLSLDQQPVRVLLGTRRIPSDFHLGSEEVLRIDHHDPALALKQLFSQGVTSSLLECGPTLAGAFMAAALVDEIVVYLAPSMLGGGFPMLAPFGPTTMAQTQRLEISDVERVGDDVRITALVKRES